MANISITVNPDTNLYTITLDIWEWESMAIWENGQWVNVPQYQGPIPLVKFQYVQQAPMGPVQFMITANSAIGILNPPTMLLLKGPNNKTYFTGIMYTNPGNQVHLLGILTTNFEALPGAQRGPLTFSQNHMTGEFNLGS